LIKNGAVVNERGYDNRTPLMSAISEGCLDEGVFLIKNGAGVNVQDKKGKTAVH